MKLPWGKERSGVEPVRPTAVSQEDESRESTVQYLAGDGKRKPTVEDVFDELSVLPMFKGLDPDVRREFADRVMSLRQQNAKRDSS